MIQRSAAWLVFLLPTVLVADEVTLRGGGKVRGVIVEDTPEVIVLETGPGRVTVPRSRVASVRKSASDLAAYYERASRLAPGDVSGWTALAAWAAERGLGTQSQEAYGRVYRLDPDSSEANRALGRVEMSGRWVTEDELNRSRGLVPFEGGWVTPGEREAVQEERAAESAAARATREADARAREAEARAREAEARARAAESEAYRNGNADAGIPLWPYVYGPVIVGPITTSRPPTMLTPPGATTPPSSSTTHPAPRPRPPTIQPDTPPPPAPRSPPPGAVSRDHRND
jgi:hypothetical protein